MLDPGLIGGLVLPILGALPDAAIIAMSGLGGSVAEAQEQVAVGMGTLAGSTVMLLTIAWAGSLVLGRCDLVAGRNGVLVAKVCLSHCASRCASLTVPLAVSHTVSLVASLIVSPSLTGPLSLPVSGQDDGRVQRALGHDAHGRHHGRADSLQRVPHDDLLAALPGGTGALH